MFTPLVTQKFCHVLKIINGNLGLFMFDKIFKLLKNIQFWTIVGTLATIISSVMIFYHPKQPDIEVFTGADSRLVGQISNYLEYDFNKSDTIAIFYLMPILEEIGHTCYYIVDLPLNVKAKKHKSIKNLMVSTNRNVPDFSVHDNPLLDTYSKPIDSFFNNSYKYPRLFVNNNSDKLIREYDKSTAYVDFYDYVPSHAHISLPLRLIFYTPTDIRNTIVDSFSFDLVFGEEDYENRHMPIKVFAFLCNMREYNENHDMDYNAFLNISSKYNTTIYVNTLMERCDAINDDYWIEQKGNHLVSYINSSIGNLHVFDRDKLKKNGNSFKIKIPDFSNYDTWMGLFIIFFLFIFASFSWIPNLKEFYSYKKNHPRQDNKFCFKFSGSEINSTFWLYAFWVGAIISYPVILLLILNLFTNIF